MPSIPWVTSSAVEEAENPDGPFLLNHHILLSPANSHKTPPTHYVKTKNFLHRRFFLLLLKQKGSAMSSSVSNFFFSNDADCHLILSVCLWLLICHPRKRGKKKKNSYAVCIRIRKIPLRIPLRHASFIRDHRNLILIL